MVGEAVTLFRDAPFRWWLCGGHALELHLGRSWRDHDDIDVGICRDDLGAARTLLTGWDIRESLNNVWARRAPDVGWGLDLTVGAGSEEHWVYRRDPTITRPWEEAVLHTPDRVPYLAPDLQLLFKSKDHRPKDDEDARQVIPELGAEARAFLSANLPAAHPWQEIARKFST